MAIEIVDLPIKNCGSFHSYVAVYQAGYPHPKKVQALLEVVGCDLWRVCWVSGNRLHWAAGVGLVVQPNHLYPGPGSHGSRKIKAGKLPFLSWCSTHFSVDQKDVQSPDLRFLPWSSNKSPHERKKFLAPPFFGYPDQATNPKLLFRWKGSYLYSSPKKRSSNHLPPRLVSFSWRCYKFFQARQIPNVFVRSKKMSTINLWPMSKINVVVIIHATGM